LFGARHPVLRVGRGRPRRWAAFEIRQNRVLDIHVACVTHITQNLDGFNSEEFVRKSSVVQMRTIPCTSLARRAPMKSPFFPRLYVFATIAACTFFLWYGGTIAAAAAVETGLDTAKIESITGLKGTLNEKENTFKGSKPRNDVPITVEQARLTPFRGFTSWAAFAPGMKDGVMVMGDMVLFEDEVNPVMSVALDKGLEVTALHNHFFFDEPKVYFMHIGGDLRGANINIVAIHQHMTGETPRMIFLHYYGRGKALALAQGVKSAINTQALAANN
jgi:Domain of Unknown Function (DUF1259)